VTEALRVGVLASGRGSNFEALVRAGLRDELGARIACLVTDNPNAGALAIAARHGIPAHAIDPGPRRSRLGDEAEGRAVEILREHGVGLVCLAGFMRIVGHVLLDAFPGAILNVHPSLLPSFPGLEAQRQALAHGVKVSGCTVHFVDAGVDAGPIVLQATVPVQDDETPETLAARILEREHVIYPEAVRLFAAGRLQVEGRRVRVLPEPVATRRAGAAGSVREPTREVNL
jgi:phosphoribosylglycinamide formyltransferase-1